MFGQSSSLLFSKSNLIKKRGIFSQRALVEVPKNLIIINGGNTFIIPVLEKIINSLKEGKNDYPKKIHLLLAPALANPAVDNDLVQGYIGQPVCQLSTKEVLQTIYGYKLIDKPLIKDFSAAILIQIQGLTDEIIKLSRDQVEIFIDQLTEESRLRTNENGDFFITHSQYSEKKIFSSEENDDDIAIIDASRVYGKFTHGELKVFESAVQSKAVQRITTPVTDLYKMPQSEILLNFEQATSPGNHVPLIGAGLVALGLFPKILKAGFTPLIINTDPNFKDYDSLMTGSNASIRNDLAKEFNCHPNEVNDKLIELTVNPENIDLNMNCDVEGMEVKINHFYDATGYCINQGYLSENIPDHKILDPVLPLQLSFAYIRTLKQKSLHEIQSIEEAKAQELIDSANALDVKKILELCKKQVEYNFDQNILDKSLGRKSFEKSVNDIDNILANLPEVIGSLNERLGLLFEDEKDIERLLRARKILIIADYLNKLENLAQMQLEMNRLISPDVLSLKQKIYKKFIIELKNPISMKIAQELRININPHSIDGRLYVHYPYAPLGSAAALKKMYSHLIGATKEFDILDVLTTHEESIKLAEEICQSMEPKSINSQYMTELITITLRRMITQDIYEFSEKEIKLKHSLDELVEIFFNIMKENTVRQVRLILDENKPTILRLIKKDSTYLADFSTDSSTLFNQSKFKN